MFSGICLSEPLVTHEASGVPVGSKNEFDLKHYIDDLKCFERRRHARQSVSVLGQDYSTISPSSCRHSSRLCNKHNKTWQNTWPDMWEGQAEGQDVLPRLGAHGRAMGGGNMFCDIYAIKFCYTVYNYFFYLSHN